MSELSEAFDELRSANEETLGNPQSVLLDGRQIRAIIEDVSTDELMLAGGSGDSGGFRASVAIADLPQIPEKGSEIEARGKVCEVLSVINRNNVVYEITAGSTAAEDA